MSCKRQIRDGLYRKHSIADRAVPLFKANQEGSVETFPGESL